MTFHSRSPFPPLFSPLFYSLVPLFPPSPTLLLSAYSHVLLTPSLSLLAVFSFFPYTVRSMSQTHSL
ncbi:hypothetical protein DsansV1_C06g0061241 [Dioscorea sansibarensis]